MMVSVKKLIYCICLGLMAVLPLSGCSNESCDEAASGIDDLDDEVDDDINDNPGWEGFDPQPEPDPRFVIRHLLKIRIVYAPELGEGTQFFLRSEGGFTTALSPEENGDVTGWIPALPGENIELALTPAEPQPENLYLVTADVTEEQPRIKETSIPCTSGCQVDITAATETTKQPHVIIYIN